jgi:hypothetical protein
MCRLMHSGNGTSVQIGNLGVVESTPPNNTKPEVSTGNYHFQAFRKNFGIWFRGKILQIVSWQKLSVH